MAICGPKLSICGMILGVWGVIMLVGFNYCTNSVAVLEGKEGKLLLVLHGNKNYNINLSAKKYCCRKNKILFCIKLSMI